MDRATENKIKDFIRSCKAQEYTGEFLGSVVFFSIVLTALAMFIDFNAFIITVGAFEIYLIVITIIVYIKKDYKDYFKFLYILISIMSIAVCALCVNIYHNNNLLFISIIIYAIVLFLIETRIGYAVTLMRINNNYYDLKNPNLNSKATGFIIGICVLVIGIVIGCLFSRVLGKPFLSSQVIPVVIVSLVCHIAGYCMIQHLMRHYLIVKYDLGKTVEVLYYYHQ